MLKMLVDEKYGCIKSLSEIGAVGHRVLHGGEMFKKSTLVDDKVVENLKKTPALARIIATPPAKG